MPIFRRCTFYGNLAQLEAGGIFGNGGRTMMDACKISMNAATTNGGGLSILSGELEVSNSEITYNHAGLVDGGVHVAAGRASFQSCIEVSLPSSTIRRTVSPYCQFRLRSFLISGLKI